MGGTIHEFGLMLYIMLVGSDGSLGGSGMARATPQVLQKKKKVF
jgi:hypothetical protein